jgi:triose/dihydroxyacetone kinase / FAD-AMP lyase (cyclizing)
MRKIINSSDTAVADYVHALAARTPDLARVDGWNVLVRAGSDPTRTRRVAVISGGGSGHEPAHAGYVGEGMLHAAVLGEVFTSPSADAVYAAIRATAGSAGALLVVKNYTGDKLNFGIAAEMARADGIPVATVLVADDVALPGEGRVGRRGIAGAVLVHKVAGAAAAGGMDLAETAAVAQAFADKLGSMGVATGPCTLPGAHRPSFDLPPGEVEWGLGIHGEPGRERGTAESAREVATRLVDQIVTQRAIPGGARVAVLVNGLGATTPLELEIVGAEVLSTLDDRRIVPVRMWTGNYLTALDMTGVSVSLVQVTDEDLALLDAPAATLSWRAAPSLDPIRGRAVTVTGTENGAGQDRQAHDLSTAMKVLTAAAEAVIAAEPALTDMDRAVGDGDLGTNLARGARRVLAEVDTLSATGSHRLLLRELAALLRRDVGGTSGPLYCLLVLGASDELTDAAPPAGTWAKAFLAGTSAVCRVGGAEVGDRTMVDALVPAAEALSLGLAEGRPAEDALRMALAAAEEGVRSTEHLRAALGRSSYLGERAVGHPDPGAAAVVVWLRAVCDCLCGGE